jgi:hypothetical protein
LEPGSERSTKYVFGAAGIELVVELPIWTPKISVPSEIDQPPSAIDQGPKGVRIADIARHERQAFVEVIEDPRVATGTD